MSALASLVMFVAGIASAAQGFGSLTLTATVEKTQVVPGEPLTLRIVVRNAGAQPVKAHRDLSPGFGMLEIAVERPGESFLRVLGPGWGTSAPKPREAELAPGSVVASEVTIFAHTVVAGRADLGASPLVFDQVGRYRIQVRWYQLGFAEHITAPVQTVEVVEPSAADRRVFEALLAETDIAALISGGSGPDAGAMAKAEKLLADAGDSALTRHLSLALGERHLRTHEPARAIIVLTRALSAPSKSVLRRSAILALAEAYARTGAIEKATALMEGAVTDFDGSPQRPAFEQMRAELKKK